MTTTKNDLYNLRREIHRLKKEIETLANSNFKTLQVLSDLDKYLVILINGYIEKHFKYIIDNFCITCNKKEFFNYVNTKNPNGFMNLKAESIKKILSNFNSIWETQFDSYIRNNNTLSSSLGEIVAKRNDIAHFNNANINIRRADCIKHYINIIKLMRELEKIVV